MERQRRSRREWQGLVTAWQKSGEPAEAFASRQGVKARTLCWWQSELNRSSARKSPATMMPVEVVPSRADVSAVELSFGSATVRFERGASPRYIAAVTRALLEEFSGA